MMAARGIEPDRHARLLSAFLDRYEHAHERTRVMPGARAALLALQDAGHPMGLCTNKPLAPARAVLRHLDLDAFFGAVTGGDSLPQTKPHPAPLHQVVAQLGEPRAIYVGDNEVDAETAANAGLPFLLYTRGYRRARVEDLPHAGAFDDFADLPGLLAAIDLPA